MIEPNFLLVFIEQSKRRSIAPMPAAEWYHRKVEEYVALAKAARLNEERATPIRAGRVLHPARDGGGTGRDGEAQGANKERGTYAHARRYEARLLR